MSFILDFLEYNSGNECPPPYVRWTAYSLLSAAIGRRVYFHMDYFTIWPNLYVLLIGDSGIKKSAAADLGITILKAAIPDIPVSADNETHQGTILYMDSEKSLRTFRNEKGEIIEYKPYCIFASEFMDYISNNPDGYIKFLTNIYDRPDSYTYRLKQENRVLTRPYVTLHACTTPIWLTDQIKAKTFGAGFGRRVVMVCYNKEKRLRPFMTEPMRLARDRCIAHIATLQNLAGPCKLEPDAEKFYWDWYLGDKRPDDPFLKDWWSSKKIIIMKLAILTSLSERTDLRITLDYIQLALGMLDEVEQNLSIVTERIGRSELVEPSLTILNMLRNNKGAMFKKELQRRTLRDFKSTTEQWQVLQHLRETDQIIELDYNDNGVMRKLVALPGRVLKQEKPQEEKGPQ